MLPEAPPPELRELQREAARLLRWSINIHGAHRPTRRRAAKLELTTSARRSMTCWRVLGEVAERYGLAETG